MDDFIFILQWWSVLFALGLIFLPLSQFLFRNSMDNFYIFSKVLGMGIVSYILLVLGTFHVLPFNVYTILFVLLLTFTGNMYLLKKVLKQNIKLTKIMLFEELLFFSGLCFWAYVRAHEPSIQSLEKFMDYGFVNSILRSNYFPPKDMWFTPFSINYYFFGHLVTAVLTKLSMVPNYISYNLMLATLFAFTLTGGFSLLFNFLEKLGRKKAILGGTLGGVLLSLSGNLHTLYSLFSSYQGEQPVPPWLLTFLPNSFPNGYWYPNATRFIPYTIHEFPLYSFIVSDLHGHVLDIPFVLLIIALSYSILKQGKFSKPFIILSALFLAIMYMTNVWDGIIYLGLLLFVATTIQTKNLHFQLIKYGKKLSFPFVKNVLNIKTFLFQTGYTMGIIVVLYILFSFPFNLNFKPFVSGFGVLCAPEFLTNIGNVGPVLFEKDHCQKSEPYQLLILYGFFLFFSVSFLGYIATKTQGLFSYSAKLKTYILRYRNETNIFIMLLMLLSFLLILAPEFVYAKDIYPAHYRANTMFKLVYQAFIMLTLTSSYSIVFLLTVIKNKLIKVVFSLFCFVLLVGVLLYPYFAIRSYYSDLKDYKGLDGTAYIKTLHPDDFAAIHFLQENISGQPVILEAQGDSYTNFGRISSNTGLPTILGWTVHEWLWRGSYDIPAPRISEIATMYEGKLSDALPLFKKYSVELVVIGNEERQKYKISEEKFRTLGKVIFTGPNKNTVIYKINY